MQAADAMRPGPRAGACQRTRRSEPGPVASGFLFEADDEGVSQLDSSANLAEVLAQLETSSSKERKHVETKSALRKVAEVLGRPLAVIPADPTKLRLLLDAATPASAGMTKKRFCRIKSLTLSALRDVGIDVMPGRDIGGHSPAWVALAERLPNRAQKAGMSRFMSYCTREGVEPEDVKPETLTEFHVALEAKSLRGDPLRTYRATVAHWNKALRQVEGWPQTPIELEAHPRFYSMPWDRFPQSFVEDVEAFLANSGSQDEFADDYARAVKPSTVALRRRQLRQVATLLVKSGKAPEEVVDLAVLVRPENATKVLRSQRDRMGKRTVSLGQQAWLLCTIARYWVKNPAWAAELNQLAAKLNVRQKGMTPRNRDRLRQFDLDANLNALMKLPAKVFAEARRNGTGDVAEARRVMMAVAVDFLTVAPMRIGNITSLEVDRHFVDFGRGGQRNRHMIVPGEETKTGERFEIILPPASRTMMDVYLSEYRPRLLSSPSAYLFPGRGGNPRSTIAFSRAISTFVERETGLKMHAHLFRQLAGKLYLLAHPSDIETVRRILGHTSAATTTRYYAEQAISQAYGAYDETITKLRAASEAASAKGRQHKGRLNGAA